MKDRLVERLGEALIDTVWAHDELTLIVRSASLLEVATRLRDEFYFEQLIDLAGVDYLTFGESEWDTEQVTSTGFSRGVHAVHPAAPQGTRFAVVIHVLSYQTQARLRLKCFLDEAAPEVDSLVSIWPAANWFEREAFDLYGIIFRHHPDLRRILTDYGFIGHPFRKDFPLSGEVEVRYDAAQKRVVYGPVEITDRVLVPKVIRHDNRYQTGRGSSPQ